MKTYERTHAWINFILDLRQLKPSHWLLLGEARSKCEHIAGVPLKATTAAHLHRLYLAKGVLATTAIEGNTLSEEQVMQHLEGKLTLPPSQQYLQKEIDNIISACNALLKTLGTKNEPALSVETIKNFNRAVLNGLEVQEGVIAGVIRSHSVGVGRYLGAPHEDCEFLLEKLCEWLRGPGFHDREDLELALPILKAIVAHLYLAWIHPFGDGNGRTARLVEFMILVGAGIPSPAAHLLSNHYNATRAQYYLELDKSTKHEDGVMSFVLYAVRGFVDQLKAQLQTVQAQELNVAWSDYVHEQFRSRRSKTAQRQRDLTLAISQATEPIPVSKIATLTPGLIESYRGKTKKTVSRDLHVLTDMGLVELQGQGVRARTETMSLFFPTRKRVD